MAVLRWLAVVAMLAVWGCTPRPVVSGEATPVRQVPPDGAIEDCFTLLAGESVSYSFRAGDPVNFDLHYHEGSATHYPTRVDHATRETGTFVAPKRGRYCLSWTNWLYAPVELTFRREIVPRQNP